MQPKMCLMRHKTATKSVLYADKLDVISYVCSKQKHYSVESADYLPYIIIIKSCFFSHTPSFCLYMPSAIMIMCNDNIKSLIMCLKILSIMRMNESLNHVDGYCTERLDKNIIRYLSELKMKWIICGFEDWNFKKYWIKVTKM